MKWLTCRPHGWLLVVALSLVAVAGVLAIPAGSATAGQPHIIRLTSDGISGLSSDMAPSFSPSGDQIAYLRFGSLWVMRSDGSHQRQLSEGPVGSYQWANDKRIVFTMLNGSNGVYDVNVPSGLTRRLAVNSDTTMVSVSNGGQTIAFNGTAIVNGDYHFHVFVMNHDGGDLRDVTPTLDYASEPALSRDGTKLAFLNGTGISVMNVDGSNLTDITASSGLALAQFPQWLPDGERVSFAGYSFPDYLVDEYVVGSDGSNLTNLSNLAAAAIGSAAWSRSGGVVAFDTISGPYIYTPYAIYTANADGSNRQLLVDGGASPSWSPNGKRIVFSADLASPDHSGLFDIYVINLN